MDILLLLIGVLLNIQKVILGINLSPADIILVTYYIILFFNKKLYFNKVFSMYFLLVVIYTLLTTLFYTTVKYYNLINVKTFFVDYIKFLISFLYLNFGFLISRGGKQQKLYTGLYSTSIIISLLIIIDVYTNIFNNILLESSRYAGFFNDPNYFSLLQLICIVLIIEFSESKKKTGISVFLVLSSIFLSASKTGVILLVSIIIIRIIHNFRNFNVKKVKKIVFSILGLYLTTLIISKVLELYIYRFPVLMRLQTLIKSPKDAFTDSGSSRVYVWLNGIKLIRENPTGVGLGSFTFINDLLFGSSAVAHNTYIQIVAEWGIILGLITISVFLIVLWGLLKSRNNFYLFQILLIFAIGSMSLSLNNSRLLWLFIGISFGLMHKEGGSYNEKEFI